MRDPIFNEGQSNACTPTTPFGLRRTQFEAQHVSDEHSNALLRSSSYVGRSSKFSVRQGVIGLRTSKPDASASGVVVPYFALRAT